MVDIAHMYYTVFLVRYRGNPVIVRVGATVLTFCFFPVSNGLNLMSGRDRFSPADTQHCILLSSTSCRYYGTETVWYRDGAGNTVEENSSVFSLIRMR